MLISPLSLKKPARGYLPTEQKPLPCFHFSETSCPSGLASEGKKLALPSPVGRYKGVHFRITDKEIRRESKVKAR
jgi:hypothetical protein